MSADTPRSITDAERAAFARDGVVKLAGVLPDRWVDTLAEGIADALSGQGPYTRTQSDPDDPGLFFSDYWASERCAALGGFVRHSPAARVAGEVMDTSFARFFFDAVWVKEPGTVKPSAWHQDQPYYCVDGADVCILWFPVDPVSIDSTLRCVKGSHRWPTRLAPIAFRDGSDFGRDGDTAPESSGGEMLEYDRHGTACQVLAWPLEPGDCLAFNGMTVHGAPGNPTGTRRRVVSTTWIGDDARFIAHDGEMEPHRASFDRLRPGEPLAGEDFPLVWAREPDTATQETTT